MRQSPQAGAAFHCFKTSTELKAMKKIEAIIKPFKLDEVRHALKGLGINDITVSEVESCGGRTGLAKHNGARAYASDFDAKIKMEFMVPDDLSGAVSAAIVEAARTGKSGDGSIFVSQVEESIRIDAKEKDQLAVC
jgi:nitrogen regulatory protein P-II 1